MQLRDFLDILGKRWKILVASIMLVVAGTVGATLQMTPIYEAQAQILLATVEEGSSLTRQALNTFVELVATPVLQDPLRKSMELEPGTPIDVTASIAEETNIVTIVARSSSAQQAADVANETGPQLADIGGRLSQGLTSLDILLESVEVAPATRPSEPVSPDMTMNVLLGLLGGLALGLGLVLLRHFLDTRIRSEVDVRAISDRPILGSLRRLRDADVNPLVVEDHPHGIAAEEYRRLRTNLQFADVTTGGQHSFVITSAMPSEGKTLTAVNLARTMADSGAKVLLVDGDLRHPSVAATLGLEGSAGLTTILLGRATLIEVAQQWGNTTLHILPAGEIPPNPSELLGSVAFEVLFNEFLRLYDYVLVDSPPIIPVVDPVLINRLVGGMVIVTTVNKTKKRDLTHALTALATVDITPAGFALNMVPGGERYGTYGAYYAYGGSSRSEKRKLAKKKAARGRGKKAAQAVEAGPVRHSAPS